MRRALMVCLATLPMTAAQAACFTVFDRLERVVYQSIEPPIDMSYPIAEQMARAYPPGHHLLVTPNGFCPGFDEPGNVYDVPLPGSRVLGGGAPALALADTGMSSFRSVEATTYGSDWAPPTAADALPSPVPAATGDRRRASPASRATARPAPARGR